MANSDKSRYSKPVTIITGVEGSRDEVSADNRMQVELGNTAADPLAVNTGTPTQKETETELSVSESLAEIVVQLRIMNAHLSIMSDERIRPMDISGGW